MSQVRSRGTGFQVTWPIPGTPSPPKGLGAIGSLDLAARPRLPLPAPPGGVGGIPSHTLPGFPIGGLESRSFASHALPTDLQGNYSKPAAGQEAFSPGGLCCSGLTNQALWFAPVPPSRHPPKPPFRARRSCHVRSWTGSRTGQLCASEPCVNKGGMAPSSHPERRSRVVIGV